MTISTIDAPTAWRAERLRRDSTWILRLDAASAQAMATAVLAAYRPHRPLFDYHPDEFDLGPGLDVVRAAMREAQHGSGIALVKGLPRAQLDEQQYALLSWAIGLHTGCARPQGMKTQYLSEVRDANTDYRARTGRGYSSSAALDFHVDSADIATLACFNPARRGGQSMISSSVTAWNLMVRECPQLAEALLEPVAISRQGAEAPDERPFYVQPVVDFEAGRLFMKWNRNRVVSAQRLDGAPPLSDLQARAYDALDAVLCRPEVMFTMYLEAGDLQVFNNRDIIHSRTGFEDHAEPARRRLLHRLWLAPPDSVPLPQSWLPAFRSVKPGAVRGGIRGHHHDAACTAFERRQADYHGMLIDDTPDGP